MMMFCKGVSRVEGIFALPERIREAFAAHMRLSPGARSATKKFSAAAARGCSICLFGAAKLAIPGTAATFDVRQSVRHTWQP